MYSAYYIIYYYYVVCTSVSHVHIGSAGPPRSRFMTFYGIPLDQIITIGLLTGLALMIAVAMLVFNVIWRKNK